jgi:hypothetical protein
MRKLYPKKENNRWVHDFLDDQCTSELGTQILDDQKIVSNRGLVVIAGLHDKHVGDFDSDRAWKVLENGSGRRNSLFCSIHLF